jgi:DNA-binding beta-propeller fold protein YncE
MMDGKFDFPMTPASGNAARSRSGRHLPLGLMAAALICGGWYTVHWINGPRLVAWDALAPENAEECTDPPAAQELPNWSGDIPLRAALMQQQAADSSPAFDAAAEIAGRKPLRIIRDPNSAYSAVAVDISHNEVVLTDENLFNVLVYDRQTNTRATSVSDPKRIIGGLNTKIEFQCGLYIDPANGDIYAVNNDTVDSLVIFSRQAIGDVKPDRELHTPHGTFGIAVDEDAKELFLSVQHDNALVVYNKLAKGSEAPIRVVQGSHTGLADPHGLALDPKKKLLFVANHGSYHEVSPAAPGEKRRGTVFPGFPLSREDAVPGSGQLLPPSISVYAKDVKGDQPPIRVIQGPKTQMDWPTALSLDLERNELFVANDGGSSILVFDASANGDVAPLRVLKGPKSLVSNPTGVYFDEKNQELWVANFGNHTSTVYKPSANGDTAPLRVIRSAKASDATPGMGNPHPIAYDTKRQQLLVPN